MKTAQKQSSKSENGEISDRGRIEIEREKFSLLYDYDREKLKKLSDEGKIKWFKSRMGFIFINPVRLLWDRSSEIYKQVNTAEMPAIEHCGFNIAIFCTVLSGVESYGAFLGMKRSKKGENRRRFTSYIRRYMKNWDMHVNVNDEKRYLLDLLWNNCRNAIAHGFRITEIGIDRVPETGKEERWGTLKNIFHINCFKFFNDFQESTECFYRDLQEKEEVRREFIKTFNEFYPS